MTKKSKINLDAAIQATPDDAIPTSWETRLDKTISTNLLKSNATFKIINEEKKFKRVNSDLTTNKG